MLILVGCEESQAVTIALRELGHEAYSCDLQDCSGGHPEWHIKADLFETINSRQWDMLICFPPCTDLAKTGGQWFERKRNSGEQETSIRFFTNIFRTNIPKIAVENPTGIMSSAYILKHFPSLAKELEDIGFPRKPDQIIQPFFFGDPFRKETNLWLKGLAPLKINKELIVEPHQIDKVIVRKGKYRTGKTRKIYWWDNVSAKVKAKTFPGIARAMAEQWTQEYKEVQPKLF